MQSPSAANPTSAFALVNEWLPQIAIATSVDELERALRGVLGAIRNDPAYAIIWSGPSSLDFPASIEWEPTRQEQELLAAGQIITHLTADKQPWTVLPLLHLSLRGWLVLPGTNPDDAALLPVALQTATNLIAISDSATLATQVRELSLLDEIGQALTSSLELNDLLGAIHSGVQRLIGPEHMFVALYDLNSGLFRFAAHFYQNGASGPVTQWTSAQGLSSVVLRQNKPLLAADYSAACAEHGVAPLILDPAAVPLGWAGVPLRHGERGVGVLAVYSTEGEMRYDAKTLHLLELLAKRANLSFEQTRLYERTVQQAKQLTLLNELGRTLTSTLDLETVPSLIMGRVQDIMDVEEGSLLLLDEDTNELVFSYSLSPFGQQLLGQRLPTSVGIAGLVLRTGQSLIANGVNEHPAFYTEIDSITGHRTRDLLCVPLLGPRGVQGVIEVLNHRNGVPFSPDDRVLLEAVADQAVIAIENASLYTRADRALARRISELDERNKQLQEILQIGNALKAATDMRAVLPQLAQAVRTATRFNQVVISVVETQSGRRPVLRRVAAVGVDPETFLAQQALTAPLERLTALLKPQYMRGAATYSIHHSANGDGHLWDDTQIYQDVPEPRLGGWHPNDRLFTVLRGVGGDILGLLAIANPMDGLLPTAEQIQTLEIFANQLVVALENTRLYDQLRQSLQGLTALSGLGMAINSAFHDAQAIWQFTVGGIVDSSGALGAGVLMNGDHPGELRSVLSLGAAHSLDEELLALANSVVSQSKPLGLLAGRHTLPATISASGGNALLMLPLFGTHDTLGVLYAWYPDLLPTPEEQDLISLFAGQASVAVENMHLAAAVREGRDRLASILASTEEAILLLTPELIVVEANATLARLAGIETLENILGQPVTALQDQWQDGWDAGSPMWDDLNAALGVVSTGDSAEARGQLELSGPRSRWLQWTALPVRSAAAVSPHPLILVLRDITAMVEAENLRQDLTYMMIHDLRGPLSSVMTSLDMLTKEMMGAINEGQEKILRIASRSSRRLLDMVNLLMDISKLEAGQMPITPRPTPLLDVIQAVVQAYEPLMSERKVDVTTTMAADLPNVAIDAATIERVIQNLLDNAIKYSPPNSSITITARPAQPGELPADHPEGAWAVVKVRDAGPGIPPQFRERVFQKFAQIQKAGIKGTGLGLTYCRLAVETHGGRIWVGGDDGPGAVFALTLPVER
jgi:signal transduction histidine kinase/transcriptional regulator with GAF, ATPase, and Fis domain